MENNQGAATGGQGAQGAAAAAPVHEPHPLDMGINIQVEDDGQIDWDPGVAFNPGQQQPAQQPTGGQQPAGEEQNGAPGQPGEGGQTGGPEGGQGTQAPVIDFNDPLVQQVTQETTENPDDLIAKLKAQGYEVNKADDPMTEKTDQISQLNSKIQEAQNFLNKPVAERLQYGLRNKLQEEFKRSRREHLIGTPEFENELQEELENLNASGMIAQSNFLSVIDNDVKSFMQDLTGKKNSLQGEVDKVTRDRQAQNRQNLQKSLTGFVQGGFLGQEIQPDVAKRAYERITSGSLQKDVNSDHNLISKFALFLELEASLGEKLGQPSYGEGVHAAKEHLKNGDLSKTVQNPLDKAMRSGVGAGGTSQGVTNNVDGRFAGTPEKGQNVVDTAGGRFS